MKKKTVAIIVLAMMVLSLLSACSNGGSAETTSASYDWTEHMTLGEYKGLPYYTEEFEVTDEEVDAQIETILLYATEIESVQEGVVEDGDTINVAFTGRIDGEEFEGGSSESYDITVGTTSMIDGFVEGLIGKNVGETVTLNLRFPDDYQSTELQGKDVVFDVTINSKRVSVTPELTDEFVQSYYEFNTVEELRNHIKEDLLEDKESSLKSNIESSLWNVILENTEITSVPEEEETAAAEQIALIEEDYKETADSYGMEWEDFLTTLLGTDEDGFKEMMDEYKDNLIKSNMVTKAIAKEEGITLSESDYKDRLLQILENNSLTEETFETYYNMSIYDYAEQNGWRESILQEMVMDKVIELGEEVSIEDYEKYLSDNLYDGEEIHVHEDGTVHEGEEETEEAEAVEEEATEEVTEETEETEEAEG